MLHAFGHLVATCEMLDGVGSSLKMVTFLLQHFRMLQDVAHIFPAPLQHLIAQSYDVTKCCMRSTEPWQANRGKREGGSFLFPRYSPRAWLALRAALRLPQFGWKTQKYYTYSAIVDKCSSRGKATASLKTSCQGSSACHNISYHCLFSLRAGSRDWVFLVKRLVHLLFSLLDYLVLSTKFIM